VATDDVAAVVATAEGAVDGSRAQELERSDEDTGWEVTVVAGDTEHEVVVSPDGTEVLSQRQGWTVDDEDRAALERATVDLAQAVETAREEVDGDLEDVSLDEEGRVLVWEVDIREPGAEDSAEVRINAEDGSMTGLER
jgi:uncharacterized membrane protein YkoI